LGAGWHGHAGLDSDVQVICLMLEALSLVGIEDVLLDAWNACWIISNLDNKAGLNSLSKNNCKPYLQQKLNQNTNSFYFACALTEGLEQKCSA
jgi:ATP phosphoribosyltransferase regulatory subunit